MKKTMNYLKRGTEEIIETEELEWKIDKVERDKRPLVIKLGVDPTAPDIHLGHTVPLMKLRQFQNLGYGIDFLIGDFTARIGDPSGRSKERKPMTEEEVMENAREYQKQIFKVLIPDLTNVVYNNDWLGPMQLQDFIKLIGKGTVNDMIKRRMVAKRIEEGNPVSVAEFVYPFLQAFDSVAMKADIEVGGTDQYFNFMFTRELQRMYGQEPQVCITMPLLVGIDGKEKMSKTYNNHIGIDEEPDEMYGKLMSVPDSLIIPYFDLLTAVDYDEVTEFERDFLQERVHPRDLKVRLASEITTIYHGKEEATKAEENFERIHKYKTGPESMDIYQVKNRRVALVDLLIDSDLAESKGAARRLIQQRGVRINGNTIEETDYVLRPQTDMVINVGKRRFKKLLVDE